VGNIVVHLATAMICFAGHCYPALVGKTTPIGDYPVVWQKTDLPGYGGDVLAFAKDEHGEYAIHRVWTLNPKQKRSERLQSDNILDRQQITNGCINVMPDVYSDLIKCCNKGVVTIEP
jgi:hypothetical protein